MPPFISIIIPIFNEEKRIANLLEIYKYFKRKHLSYEVIVVNDGSTDQTVKKLTEISKNFKFKLISYRKNQGKGYAIKLGMMGSGGKYRLFTDIDLSTPIEEFNKFIPYLENYDIIIGSRKQKGSKLLIHQPKLREELGKGFTKLAQMCLDLDLSDFTCGFKCFSKKAAVKVFSRQKIDRWGFDAETIFVGKKKGFLVKEIPVVWKNHTETKVKLPQDVINSLFDLIRIRYNEIKGVYD